jgi:hypothetical protein
LSHISCGDSKYFESPPSFPTTTYAFNLKIWTHGTTSTYLTKKPCTTFVPKTHQKEKGKGNKIKSIDGILNHGIWCG